MRNLEGSQHIRISEILKFFFAIPPEQIRGDLEILECQADEHRRRESDLRASGCESSKELVESLHRRLLLGVNMLRSSMLPSDLILFSATVTAHEIAELSCSDSCGRGRSYELCQILESLEESGDLDQASVDVLSSDSMVAQIHDAVFLEVLKRYEMDQFVDLFENNRPLYEIRCAVGRQLILGDLDDEKEHAETVASFRKLYGPEFVQEYLRRLKSHDLLPD